MPIIESKRGKNTFKEVVFGTGDIVVASAREPEEKTETMLLLIQDVQKPKEEWNKTVIEKGVDTDQINTNTIVLKFTAIESIDVLIEKLEYIKDSMFKAAEEEFKNEHN